MYDNDSNRKRLVSADIRLDIFQVLWKEWQAWSELEGFCLNIYCGRVGWVRTQRYPKNLAQVWGKLCPQEHAKVTPKRWVQANWRSCHKLEWHSWETLLFWLGLNRNIVLDLDRKAESPKVTALGKEKRWYQGFITVGEVATHNCL